MIQKLIAIFFLNSRIYSNVNPKKKLEEFEREENLETT
jgi:hypothetical protein